MTEHIFGKNIFDLQLQFYVFNRDGDIEVTLGWIEASQPAQPKTSGGGATL